MKESMFQAKLIKELKRSYPGSVILKTDANYIQGFPDLLMLYQNKWAAFEVKKNAQASHQPNQDYYVRKLGKMSFARFIYPENKEEVMNDLARSFGRHTRRCSRGSVAK